MVVENGWVVFARGNSCRLHLSPAQSVARFNAASGCVRPCQSVPKNPKKMEIWLPFGASFFWYCTVLMVIFLSLFVPVGILLKQFVS